MARRTRTTVSAVLIVKDEQDVLESCLQSVAWADEVVVYDTGSTDGTLDIARRLATTVVEGYWDDDFAAARNRAAEHATGDWILTVDADEVLEGDPEPMRRRLARTAADVGTLEVVDAAHVGRGPAFRFTSVRLHRRGRYAWRGELHEQLVATGPDGAHGGVAIPHVRLLHSGYSAAVFAEKDKADRNARIAEQDLHAAQAAGASAGELAERRANLARSRVLEGRCAEAFALAREAQAGPLSRPAATLLATAMFHAAGTSGDAAEREHWFDAWCRAATNLVWPLAARVRVLAEDGDAPGTLATLARVPTTTVDVDGRRFDRAELAQFEVWALAVVGRVPDALAVAVGAVRRGHQPSSPAGLMRVFDEDGVRAVLAAVPDRQWQGYAVQCAEAVQRTADGAPAVRRFLELMHEVRPDDPAAPLAAGAVARALSLDEATAWSVALRRLGLAESCPLTTLAGAVDVDPCQRALAGALAWDVFGDERARDGLQDALGRVPAEREQGLLADLEVVAPGLVSRAR